jgi:hypothetical protein
MKKLHKEWRRVSEVFAKFWHLQNKTCAQKKQFLLIDDLSATLCALPHAVVLNPRLDLQD